ncbi:MAG: hypothetical protein COB85_06245 [Bacteroidetes bacterium]|nr:MAG: hypothetical protein COB85_06245 [Bacteroidota bacterium]
MLIVVLLNFPDKEIYQMWMCKTWTFLIAICLLLACNGAFAQFKILEDNSARISVLSGGNVPFIFNSINKYASGVTYTNWTRLGLTYVDSCLACGIGFELYVRAADVDGDGAITSDDGANTIPFNVIEMQVSNAVGLPAGPTVYAGPTPLSNVDALLLTTAVDTADATTHQIFVTYTIGTNPCPCPPGNNILDQSLLPDHYLEELIFTLCRTGDATCP